MNPNNLNEIGMMPLIKPRILCFEDDQPITERVDMCQQWQCIQWRNGVAYAPKLVTYGPQGQFRRCPKCGMS